MPWVVDLRMALPEVRDVVLNHLFDACRLINVMLSLARYPCCLTSKEYRSIKLDTRDRVEPVVCTTEMTIDLDEERTNARGWARLSQPPNSGQMVNGGMSSHSSSQALEMTP